MTTWDWSQRCAVEKSDFEETNEKYYKDYMTWFNKFLTYICIDQRYDQNS